MPRAATSAQSESGFAIIIVLLVLLALLVMCTPFLLSSRNADRASGELADRAAARIALDSAERHARANLGATYPSQDKTPYWDSLDEIKVDNRFDPQFLDANDAHGVMWDLEVGDVAGEIDLNSASPCVIANMLGATARFADVIGYDAKKLPISSTSGLMAAGFVWADGELIQYGKVDDGELKDFTRGVNCPAVGKDWHGGPRPPSDHDNGAPVLDQRAFAPALWRTNTGDGEIRRFGSMEELRFAKDFVFAGALSGDPSAASKPSSPANGGDSSSNASASSANPFSATPSSTNPSSTHSSGTTSSSTNSSNASSSAASGEMWGEETMRALAGTGSVFGGVRGGHVWQRAAKLASAIEGRKDGQFRVDNLRWFNAGSTIQIRDGKSAELAIVSQVKKDGMVLVDRIFVNDYSAYSAEVRVLARRPVNINTARRDVLTVLFTNLQIMGRNSRITKDRAGELADLVVQSRPFTGHEDFLRRVVLPAAGLEKLPADAEVHPDILMSGSGFIDAYEALALYTNGLNANDSSLLYSTMPYCYTTRDTYDLELRASVNAPSGVERFSLVRDEVDVVTPQSQLFALWARQEDFDEQMRLDCEAPWWATGPSATSRWDHGAVPPSRLWSHMGTYAGRTYLPGVSDMSGMQDKESQPTAEHVFASREKDGYIQLWPSRVDELGQRTNRVLHFDQETRDLEGRYLPDEPIQRDTTDVQVAWSGKNALMLPLSFSLWVKPRSLADGTILDVVSGTETLSDRLSLLFEQGDLVLRVMDGPGDHPQTPQKEYGEVRYQLATGQGPGMPTDIWSHIDVDVRGNQPHQMSMLVNGLNYGVRTPGLTRLTGSIDQSSSSLPVESIEGFPPQCTVRVGNELIEVVVANGKMDATRTLVGPNADFGGRLAREKYSPLGDANNMWLPENIANMNPSHPSGTAVELYGYSLPLYTSLPVGHIPLGSALGKFRIAQVKDIVGGAQAHGDLVQMLTAAGPYPLGLGMESGTGPTGAGSHVTGLVLVPGDQPDSTAQDFMTAFNPTGGYAAVMQYQLPLPGQTGPSIDLAGGHLGGVEIIRYSGYTGTTLQGIARGNTLTELARYQNVQPATLANRVGGTRAFVSFWYISIGTQGIPAQNYLDMRTYVVPISLAVPGATLLDYNQPPVTPTGSSGFAQLTHIQDAEHTEWVRYEENVNGQLVRDEPVALSRALDVIVGPAPPAFSLPPSGGPGGGGTGGVGGNGGTGGNGGSNNLLIDLSDASSGGARNDGASASGSDAPPVEPMVSASAPPTAPSAASQAQGYGAGGAGFQWDPRIGASESPWSAQSTAPLSEAVSTALQFRGVFGTYTHDHPAGTPVLPVFTTAMSDADGGRPGRLDVAFLVGSQPNHIGWPVRVHRSFIPGTVVPLQGWKQDNISAQNMHPQPIWSASTPAVIPQDTYLNTPPQIYVALQDKSPELMTPGTSAGANATTAVFDTRGITRLMAFPSGERPRLSTRMSIGGGASGGTGGASSGASGAIPSAVVDEIVFGDAKFGRTATADPETGAGGSLILTTDLAEAGTTMIVAPLSVRVAIGRTGAGTQMLASMRTNAGLLRIGDEIVGYNQLDASSGTITIAPSGRGLLGTRPQTHQTGEPVMYLEHHTVTALSGPVGAADSVFPVTGVNDVSTGTGAATTDFANEGTALIGSELIHYTRLRDNKLEMPRASSVPGAMDDKGDGIFRGRYGTTVAAHSSGELVIIFPFRYWDRWAPRADGPELSYFSLGIDQPAAYWDSFFFVKTDTESNQIGVLQRTSSDAPWDADPEQDKRVKLFWKGDEGGQPIPIGVQSNGIEWRVFVKYGPNAFDPKTGLNHGWKESPRLRQLGAFYYGPNVVLRSIER
jgi:hypothetical protein